MSHSFDWYHGLIADSFQNFIRVSYKTSSKFYNKRWSWNKVAFHRLLPNQPRTHLLQPIFRFLLGYVGQQPVKECACWQWDIMKTRTQDFEIRIHLSFLFFFVFRLYKHVLYTSSRSIRKWVLLRERTMWQDL